MPHTASTTTAISKVMARPELASSNTSPPATPSPRSIRASLRLRRAWRRRARSSEMSAAGEARSGGLWRDWRAALTA